ncbi:MAG TPA: flagellar basal body-associated FliL family protein [Mariprofundaceae bacterium]|nr:flagellar basal body-associated FliL family protein [Mariprofundaceae bacterium]
MADEQVEGEVEEKGKKKKSSGGMLQKIILILLVLLLGLGGFIAWKLVTLKTPVLSGQAGSHSGSASADQKAQDKPGIYMSLDDITVNLADVEEARFLRAKIKLEVKDKQAEKSVKANMARVKDLIITVLSSKTFDDVRTSQGKFALKEELAYRINRAIGGHPVLDVYFTNFVAQ